MSILTVIMPIAAIQLLIIFFSTPIVKKNMKGVNLGDCDDWFGNSLG